MLLYVGQYTNLWWLRQLELQIVKAVPQCQRYQVGMQCEEEFVIPEIIDKILRGFMSVNVKDKYMRPYPYEIGFKNIVVLERVVTTYFHNHHEIYNVLEL